MRSKLFKAGMAGLIIFIILTITLIICRGLFPTANEKYVKKYCREYGVKPQLVYALIKAESNFRKNAVSSADAKGLMQLTDETFEFCMQSLKINSGDVFDPETNIRAGVWYLSYLLDRYNGNTQNAIAAYNAGFTNVDRWLSNSKYSSDGKVLNKIPYDETRRHVKKITDYVKVYEFLYPELRSA